MNLSLNDINNLINNNDFDTACNALISLEEKYQNNAEYWMIRGNLLYFINDLNQAIECYKYSISLDNSLSQSHYRLAEISEEHNDYINSAIHYGLAYKYSTDDEIKNILWSNYNPTSTLRNIFECAAKKEKSVFVFLSSTEWGVVHQRMHHLPKALSSMGYKSYFLQKSVDISNENIIHNKTDIHLLNQFTRDTERLEMGVHVRSPFLINKDDLVLDNYYSAAMELIEELSKTGDVVVVNYRIGLPLDIADNIKKKATLIYDCVDDSTDLEYSEWWTSGKTLIQEPKLMSKAHKVTVTSTALFLKHAKVENRDNIYLIKNAVNECDFICSEDVTMPEDLKSIPTPRIVYAGAMYSRFDKDLIFKVAKIHSDKAFVFITFGDEEDMNSKPNNVYFIGAKKHSELKNYFKYMDVGVIPFRDTMDGVIACDSIKHYEYLACGLPVVTTLQPEAGMNKPYTFMASSPEDFAESITQALNQNIKKEDMQIFLIDNSWVARAVDFVTICDKKGGIDNQNKAIMQTSELLNSINTSYNIPIYKTMEGMLYLKQDMKKSLALFKEAYEYNKIYFVEKYYVNALMLNNNILEAMSIIKESSFSDSFIKQECVKLKHNNQTYVLFKILFFVYMKNIVEAIKLLSLIKDKKQQEVYHNYIFQKLNNNLIYP